MSSLLTIIRTGNMRGRRQPLANAPPKGAPPLADSRPAERRRCRRLTRHAAVAAGAQAPRHGRPRHRVSFIRMLSAPGGRGWLVMCTPDGSGCALAAPDRRFASVADALRIGRDLGTYLNSPAAADLDGPGRAEALEQLGAITSLLGAAANGLIRRFDAADDHDGDGYATTAAWLAAQTRLRRTGPQGARPA